MNDIIKKILSREEKWQKKWNDAKSFTPTNDGKKPKYYDLVEFPFPSGSGLHVGHMLPYTGMDVIARYKRMSGYDVLYPFGYDSMGIAAEHYAVKAGKHPSDSVRELIQIFEKQIKCMGLSFDPDAKIATSDPEYIKWTQWQFIQFFKAGLVYRDALPMNWCPNCKTNLTNEELEDGRCERCGGPVEKKMKEQWNIRITKYADRLIDDLSTVDYPERVKTEQINWIGKSIGADVDFRVGDDIMTVFTTRVDTIFGVTFCVIAPEHELVKKWLENGKIKNPDAVIEYQKMAAAKSEIERTNMTREKSGVKLDGIMVENPYNNTEIPLYISDYVLANYGYGAIMAVPAHDERDYEFAKKFDIEIIPVLDGGDISAAAFTDEGPHINSKFLDGMGKNEAINFAIEYGEKHGFARKTTKYRLKDWGFSRQMYWGEPIPLIYCEHCGWQPVPDNELPVMQPHMDDFRPTDDGESPLARATDWVKTKCPKCGGDGRRETDTMPGWAGSSWYFLRYVDPHNDNEFADQKLLKRWLPVDIYNGGNEHNTRHLLYARFWHKALFDLGLVPTSEPFSKRTSSGLMMGEDGQKMSKSKGNAVSSSTVTDRTGADAARTTILFLGPWELNMIWSEETLSGVSRFLKRVEGLFDRVTIDAKMDNEQNRMMNQLVSDMTDRIDSMKFNTAIAAMMEYSNFLYKYDAVPTECYETLLKCLNPFAPHMCEELWEKLGHSDMLVFTPWPTFDPAALVSNTMTIVVSVNGKRRAEISVDTKIGRQELISNAREMVEKYLTGDITNTIVVPNKMVNFVIKG